MTVRRRRCLAVAWVVLALACGPPPDAGPVDLAWDRDACEHCQMAISDRLHAAQVRVEGDRNAHVFDDLGCALLFVEASRVEPREVWVRSVDGGDWVDGLSARYERGRNTPMGYGFGPLPEGATGLALAEVRAQVRAEEQERRGERPSREAGEDDSAHDAHEGHRGH